MGSVRLVWLTPAAERTIAFCARVSSNNQDNPEIAGLLKYCARKGHWSVFEQAAACFEIVDSRAITRQILRHKSMFFQEFSQRYSSNVEFEYVEARRQDEKNRQNSLDDLDATTKQWFLDAQSTVTELAKIYYEGALTRGIAKECARALLPEGITQSRLYATGSIRSWIHYIAARTDESTQLEHRLVAEAVRDILAEELPVIAEAFEWGK